VVALVLGHRGDAGRGEAQEGAAGLVARGYRGSGTGSRHGGGDARATTSVLCGSRVHGGGALLLVSWALSREAWGGGSRRERRGAGRRRRTGAEAQGCSSRAVGGADVGGGDDLQGTM
jgi:hypothetical protein